MSLTTVRLSIDYQFSGVSYKAGNLVSIDSNMASQLVSISAADNNATAIANAVAAGQIVHTPTTEGATQTALAINTSQIVSINQNTTLNTNNSGQSFASANGNYTVTPVAGLGGFTLIHNGIFDLSASYMVENIAEFSQIVNGYWQQNSNTITANYGPGFDGTPNAASAVTGGGGAYLGLNGLTAAISPNPFGKTPGAQFVISFWIKGFNNGTSDSTQAGNNQLVIGTYSGGITPPRVEQAITLTGNWQQVVYPFTVTSNSITNLYLSTAPNNGNGGLNIGNIAGGAQYQIDGFQICAGNTQHNFIRTYGASFPYGNIVKGVSQTSQAQPTILIKETSPNSGIFVGQPIGDKGPGVDSSFLIIKDGSRKVASIVLAAGDSYKAHEADYIINSANADVIISNAYAALRGYGGKILLKAGTYPLGSGTIVADADGVTLEGESKGSWGGYINSYNVYNVAGYESNPVGAAKLKATVPGNNIITFGTTYQDVNSPYARHCSMVFKNLMLFGANNSGIGIYDSVATDVSEIESCFFQNLATAINIKWDTPFITKNSIQSCSGAGIIHTGPLGTISQNIIWDNGGVGITLNNTVGQGTQVVGNQIGSLSGTGISISSGSGNNVISGNTISAIRSGNGIDVNAGGKNVITGNTISISPITGGTNSTPNTTGIGVYLHGNSTYSSINGNVINSIEASNEAAYAVQVDAGSNNNNIMLNVCSGYWNNSTAAVAILNNGTNTLLHYNQGNGTA